MGKDKKLDKYNSKRDENIFVVQEHHSSHLHYDFRLQMEGVLKSWAVPKGISQEPSIRRLAVPTEDHPLGYANFEGAIPEGEYGAGKVIIWDKGTYENLNARQSIEESYKAGKLEVLLKGKKLKGGFALIRLKKNPKDKEASWIIIKMKND
ncbi:MAG: DNA polymerase ligase N-terminal domain-containing protein [Armatimonadota bacterium]